MFLSCAGSPQRRRKRWTRKEKGKKHCVRPTKPVKWVPTVVEPNLTGGVRTRSVAAAVAQYNQQLLNDDNICNVLADFGGYESLEDMVAPESLHSVGSMETCNINLWDSVFRDDAWRTSEPIVKHAGFGVTHPGGALERPVLVQLGGMPDRFTETYLDWSCRRGGWAVLVPNRFLSEASFHTGDTPSWTQGDVIGEGVHAATGRKMVVCDLGGYNSECHLLEENVRVADGP